MEHGKTLIGNGLSTRRRGYFAHSGCRRGAHGGTRPTTLGARQGLSISGNFGASTPKGADHGKNFAGSAVRW
jgi:hypothetical protein